MVRVLDFKGRSIANYGRAVSVGYLVAAPVFEIPLNSIAGVFSKEEFFINAYIEEDEKVIASVNHYFAKPSLLKLIKPNLNYSVSPTDSGATILISTDVLTKGVMLEFENIAGSFSDNYFDLLPGVQKEIHYTGATTPQLKVTFLNPKNP